MTTKEDKLFLDILDAVDCESIDNNEMMRSFAFIYKEKVEKKEIVPNPMIMNLVKDLIPEVFL